MHKNNENVHVHTLLKADKYKKSGQRLVEDENLENIKKANLNCTVTMLWIRILYSRSEEKFGSGIFDGDGWTKFD